MDFLLFFLPGADLFESYVGSIIASCALATTQFTLAPELCVAGSLTTPFAKVVMEQNYTQTQVVYKACAGNLLSDTHSIIHYFNNIDNKFIF